MLGFLGAEGMSLRDAYRSGGTDAAGEGCGVAVHHHHAEASGLVVGTRLSPLASFLLAVVDGGTGEWKSKDTARRGRDLC